MANPHQPHLGGGDAPERMAPKKYYDRLPALLLTLPCRGQEGAYIVTVFTCELREILDTTGGGGGFLRECDGWELRDCGT